jgi:hypothetical protein
MTDRASEQEGGIGGMSPRTLLFALARMVGWLVVPLYMVGTCAGYFLEHSAGLWNRENPVENVAWAGLNVGFGAFAVVGALLVAKRPTNLIGWIMAAVALMVAIFGAGTTTPPT